MKVPEDEEEQATWNFAREDFLPVGEEEMEVPPLKLLK